MKRVAKKVFAVLSPLVLFVGPVYLVTAFIAWEENPAMWSVGVRLVFAAITIPWLWLIYTSKSRQKALEKMQESHGSVRKVGGFQAMLQKQLEAAEQARKAQDN